MTAAAPNNSWSNYLVGIPLEILEYVLPTRVAEYISHLNTSRHVVPRITLDSDMKEEMRKELRTELEQSIAEEIRLQVQSEAETERKQLLSRIAQLEQEVARLRAAPTSSSPMPASSSPATTTSVLTYTRSKYDKMAKLGLGEGPIRCAMVRDGLSAAQVDEYFGSVSSATAASAPANPSTAPVDPAYAKYHKMRKMGMCDGAINNAILRDGLDPQGFFNPGTTSNGTQATTPGPPPKSQMLNAISGFKRGNLKKAQAPVKRKEVESPPPASSAPAPPNMIQIIQQKALERKRRLTME